MAGVVNRGALGRPPQRRDRRNGPWAPGRGAAEWSLDRTAGERMRQRRDLAG
jgi:hypothetical protein